MASQASPLGACLSRSCIGGTGVGGPKVWRAAPSGATERGGRTVSTFKVPGSPGTAFRWVTALSCTELVCVHVHHPTLHELL